MRRKNKALYKTTTYTVVKPTIWNELKRDKQAFGRIIPGIKPGNMSESDYQKAIKYLEVKSHGYRITS